ncbi:MAG: T9SS type A sorting domain-containing protein, partial [Bacteroidota bacterium]
ITHDYMAAGTYTVTMISTAHIGTRCCIDTLVFDVVVTANLVFPSPTSSRINVLYDVQDDLPVTIQLVDMSGKVLGTLTEQPDGHASFQVDHLSAGTYLVRVRSGQGERIEKFIKE